MRMIKFRLRIGSEIVGYELFSSSTVGGGWFYLDIKALNPHWKREQGVPDSYIYHTEKDQYTGLHDKNGKKIYEGDIVKLDSWAGVQQIRFIEGAFCLANDKGMFVGDIHYCQHGNQKQAVVIGNVYENPELLKVKL